MTSSIWIILLCLLHIIAHNSALNLPDLNKLFGSYFAKTNEQEEEIGAKERVKRQDPGIGDESQLHYEIIAAQLPPDPSDSDRINLRYMPTLGNGHLATTIYGDSVYLNGLYAGSGTESHRAMIPAIVMAKIKLSNEDTESRATRKYILNARDGFYMETIDCDFAFIEHRIYIHKHFIRVLVSTISWRVKQGSVGGGNLILQYPNFTSEDVQFGERHSHHSHYQVHGSTRGSEEGSSEQGVHMFYMDPLKHIGIMPSDQNRNYTTVMAIDRQESSARAEFDECLYILGSGTGTEHWDLFALHQAAWQKVWSEGQVMVEGDIQLAKITTFAQYYILTSLTTTEAYQPPQHSEFLYGVARSSLAKGGKGKDYQGHVMWDNEIYILPAMVFFQPELVKRALRYRTATGPAALTNAESIGSKGYKYPFRSGYTGLELGTCPTCDARKIHVSAAVAFGIRTYFSATRDQDYLNNPDYNGCDITREIARFLAHQSIYNPETGRYDMKNITGPDETYPHRDNNAYTLVLSSLAIHWARYMACQCQRNERDEVPDEWVQMAMYYDLPYDNMARVHYQFSGFEDIQSPRINQSDTIMLTYPLNWNMSRDIMRHDLEYYEQITSDVSPAMTWSFFTIGWKWVDEVAKMNSFFLKSYQDYLIQPFKIWTEFNEANAFDQTRGTVNFLPGMGGFLQSIIYGFAGIRLRPEMLEFHNPKPPQGLVRIRLNGLKYLGTIMSFTIEEQTTSITVHEVGEIQLVLKKNGTVYSEESLNAGAVHTIENPIDGFYIYTNQPQMGCEHPRDHVYMPWGYSPFVNTATSKYISNTMMVSLVLFLCLIQWPGLGFDS